MKDLVEHIDNDQRAGNLPVHLKRFINLLTAIGHYLWWFWRLDSFGWRSRLARPDMLTNPRAISIGKNVLIRKGARLEAVGEWDGKRPKIKIGDGTSIQFYFHCGAVRPEPVRHDRPRPAVALHRTLQEPQRSLAIPPFRSENLKHLALVIDRTPEVMCFAIDPHKHLVQMPTPLRI